MTEAPEVIRMNVDRYRAMLSGCLDSAVRTSVERLLAEALRQLAHVAGPNGL